MTIKCANCANENTVVEYSITVTYSSSTNHVTDCNVRYTARCPRCHAITECTIAERAGHWPDLKAALKEIADAIENPEASE